MENEKKKISEAVKKYGIPVAYSPIYSFMDKVEQYLKNNRRRRSWS